MKELKNIIETVYEDRKQIKDHKKDIESILDLLDQGKIRVAEQVNGQWQVNSWVKKGILLNFSVLDMYQEKAGPFEYHDKVPLKSIQSLQGVRVVPGAVVRRGTFVEESTILMPSFVNIGAYIGSGSMIDTWATVGSCAQIGSRVHLSGGVGIGGVLEPPQADPVIIEDDVFVGSRAIVVEGVRVCKGAVLGANVVLTQSTPIIDVSNNEEKVVKGIVPENSVVIPGQRMKKFPAGEYGVPCALIIGKRKESTNKKTSLNEALREFAVSV